MKGVSSVIAIILILMIVIALAALAYTWFSGIFASLTATAGSAVTTTTGAMATQFRIESARWSGGAPPGTIGVWIRNIGTQSFNASIAIVGIYVDNALQSVTIAPAFIGCSGTGQIAEKGCVVQYGFTAPTLSCTCPGTCKNITAVTIGTGLTDSMTIVC